MSFSGTAGVLCKWRYCCAVFIGLTMGLCAFLVDVLLETLNNWKFGAVNSVIRNRGGFWLPIWPTWGSACCTQVIIRTLCDNTKGAQPHLSRCNNFQGFLQLFLLGPGMPSQAACSQIWTKDNETPFKRCTAWKHLVSLSSS